MHWHNVKEVDIFRELQSSKNGLSEFEHQERILKHGKNAISKEKRTPEILMFLKQFNSPLIYVLFVAAIISLFFNHLVDAYVIFAVVLFDAVIGYFQERKAVKAIDALKKMIVSYAKVLRDGKIIKIPAENLVPGDVILLEEGDKVPADARLFEIKNFRTQESSLTGESLPSEKSLGALSENVSLGDRSNMVYMGTLVVSGTAKAIIVGTGNQTEIGKVAKSIREVVVPKLHFNQKVKQLTILLASLAFAGASLTFIIGLSFDHLSLFDIFLFSIASLVSGIPEGLPAILAIVLAVGASRMAKRNAIIRHLPAVETLGVATVIATDKTGTLTQNTLNVQEVITANSEFHITGEGWVPEGKFFISENEKLKPINPLQDLELKKILEISALSNKSNLTRIENKNSKGLQGYDIIGDPTEVALLVLARKAGLDKSALENSGKFKILDDLPFSSDLKFRASIINYKKSSQSQNEIVTIGAFEKILEESNYLMLNNRKVTLDKKKREEFLDKANDLASRGIRVLGIAYKPLASSKKLKENSLDSEDVKDLIFVGLTGMTDPPRPSVKNAIQRARNAGVRVIMQTGDYETTALSIAKDIGLISKEEYEDKKVLTGLELEKLSKEEFVKAVKEISVFARVTPKMKIRIVQALQEQGEIVAMTGDGVNDAPALKGADIGIAMGVIGTDVARESSEMVLADDNFATIVNAIEEGRIVFRNVRQASTYLVTTNVSEDLTIITSLLLKLPLPLLPIHILWMNLFTDGFNGFALAMEGSHGTALQQKPRSKKERILNHESIPLFLIVAPIMVLGTVFIFQNFYNNFGIEKAMTGVFMVMTLCQLFQVLNTRSLHKSIFQIGLFSNKYVMASLLVSLTGMFALIYIPIFDTIFKLTPLTGIEMISIFLYSSLVLIAGEIYKFVRYGGGREVRGEY